MRVESVPSLMKRAVKPVASFDPRLFRHAVGSVVVRVPAVVPL
jgi:hypothetical protein